MIREIVTNIGFNEAMNIKKGDPEGVLNTLQYHRLDKIAAKIVKWTDGPDEYKKEKFIGHEVEETEEQLEIFYFVIKNLESIVISKDFDDAVVSKVNKLLKSANNCYNRGVLKLKKAKDGDKVGSFNPIYYYRNTLALLQEYFGILGVEWDYDVDFKYSDKPFDELSPRDMGLHKNVIDRSRASGESVLNNICDLLIAEDTWTANIVLSFINTISEDSITEQLEAKLSSFYDKYLTALLSVSEGTSDDTKLSEIEALKIEFFTLFKSK